MHHAEAPAVTVDETVRIYDLPESEEAQTFGALFAFFAGRQHDHCPAHFDGSRRIEGEPYYRERYYTRGFVPPDRGNPLNCKPDVTTPIAREIVETFTTMLLGRMPHIHVPIDSDTASFYSMIWRHGKLQASWTRARNMAGAARAAIVVPQLVGGRPSLEVLPPSECMVLRWSDRELCQPAMLVRQRLITKAVRGDDGKLVQRRFWRTCGWDETHYIDWHDVPEDHPREEPLVEAARTPHGCKRCPATWYRNTNEGGDCPWGRHDFQQLEGRCDAIDRLGSQLRGSVGNNTDPTMFQADEEGTRRRYPIRSKGRGTLVQLSEKGRVGFAEISATAIDAALRYVDHLVDDTFALAHCVRITPQLVQAAKSGKHMQVLFRPAENYAALVGIELADAICRVFELYFEMAQTFGVSSIEEPREGTIILPSRIVREDPEEAAEDAAEGEQAPASSLMQTSGQRFEPCAPGRFGSIELTFGEPFEALAEEKNQVLGGLQAAAGGEPILSRKTAIESAAIVLGADPVEECRRIAVEDAERTMAFQAQQELMADKAENEGAKPPPAAEGEADEEEEEDAAAGDEREADEPA